MADRLILLTNDDGIHSPGLWAAAATLQALGEVVVVAPQNQCTSIGRSMPTHSTGRIATLTQAHAGRVWTAYAVDGTPAQAVQHALLEILPRRPDLVVAGINYGDNVGTGVTVSGTVGATLEAASFGVPALAVSQDTDPEHHYSHSEEVDFSGAGYFTAYFAARMLAAPLPADVDILKIEVPRHATPATRWRMTRLSRTRFYFPVKAERLDWSQPGPLGYRVEIEHDRLEPDSDVRAVAVDGVVAVTPLSVDLTSRVDLDSLARQLAG
ncbi:MAG: 5'/3'-nucleotidase SurE [Anaerolineales bacterium]|nr:5'/3'-nucleotidase SurE [Anaerolineales bacterium]